jgi:hypothetical protein
MSNGNNSCTWENEDNCNSLSKDQGLQILELSDADMESIAGGKRVKVKFVYKCSGKGC